MDETLDALMSRLGPFPAGTVCVISLASPDVGLLPVRGVVRLRQADLVVPLGGAAAPAVRALLRDHACLLSPVTRPAWEDIRRQAAAGRKVVVLCNDSPDLEQLAGEDLLLEVIPGTNRPADPRWLQQQPLFGQRVLVTRPWQQSAVLAGRLSVLGAEVIEAPTVAIAPPADHTPVDDALGRLAEYDWLILTSVNGVDAVAERLRHLRLDARALGSVRIAAIGPATADRIRELFLEPDLVPEEYVAEALAGAMGAGGLAGQRCLLLRSDIARQTLPDLLRAAGAACDDIPAYRTTRPDSLPPEALAALREARTHWATFTSSSTFSNFVALLGGEAGTVLPHLKLASIGPITSRTIRAAGYEPAAEAAVYTVEGLVDAIVEQVGRP